MCKYLKDLIEIGREELALWRSLMEERVVFGKYNILYVGVYFRSYAQVFCEIQVYDRQKNAKGSTV
jgi:hypothetical protein